MCPNDSTPDPRDMERMPEAQAIPEGRSTRKGGDVGERPPLPDRPVRMPADDAVKDRP